MPEIVLFLKSITDDISEENVEKIFDGLDDSGDQSIDFEEFKVKMIFILFYSINVLDCDGQIE